MSEHSEISPSMFSRVRQCPGSVQASRGIPEPEAGEAAEKDLASADVLRGPGESKVGQRQPRWWWWKDNNNL